VPGGRIFKNERKDLVLEGGPERGTPTRNRNRILPSHRERKTLQDRRKEDQPLTGKGGEAMESRSFWRKRLFRFKAELEKILDMQVKDAAMGRSTCNLLGLHGIISGGEGEERAFRRKSSAVLRVQDDSALGRSGKKGEAESSRYGKGITTESRPLKRPQKRDLDLKRSPSDITNHDRKRHLLLKLNREK